MTNYKVDDKIMFSTNKGTVKIGTIVATNDRLVGEEYEEVFIIETEGQKVYHINENHIIQKLTSL